MNISLPSSSRQSTQIRSSKANALSQLNVNYGGDEDDSDEVNDSEVQFNQTDGPPASNSPIGDTNNDTEGNEIVGANVENGLAIGG